MALVKGFLRFDFLSTFILANASPGLQKRMKSKYPRAERQPIEVHFTVLSAELLEWSKQVLFLLVKSAF